MAVRIDGPKAAGSQLRLNLILTDQNRSYVLDLENAVLHYRRGDPDPNANVSIRVTRPLLVRLFTRQVGLRELLTTNALDIDGSRLDLISFLTLLETPDPSFPIVTP